MPSLPEFPEPSMPEHQPAPLLPEGPLDRLHKPAPVSQSQQIAGLIARHAESLARVLEETAHGEKIPLYLVQRLLSGFTAVPQLAPDIADISTRIAHYAAHNHNLEELWAAIETVTELPREAHHEWSPGLKSGFRLLYDLDELAKEFGKAPNYHRLCVEGLTRLLQVRDAFGQALTDGDIFVLERGVSRHLENLAANDWKDFEQHQHLAVIACRLFLETRKREHPFDVQPLLASLNNRVAEARSEEITRELTATPDLNGDGKFDRELVMFRRRRFEFESLLIDLALTLENTLPELLTEDFLNEHIQAFRYLYLPQYVDKASHVVSYWGVAIRMEGHDLHRLRDHLDDHGRFVYASHDLLHQLLEIDRQRLLEKMPSVGEIIATLTEDSPEGDRGMLNTIHEALRRDAGRRSLLAAERSQPKKEERHQIDFELPLSIDTALGNLERLVESRRPISEDTFWQQGGAHAVRALGNPGSVERATTLFCDLFLGDFSTDVVTVVTQLAALREHAGEQACLRCVGTLGNCLRRENVTDRLRSWQKHVLPTLEIPVPYLTELLETSYDPFPEGEEVAGQLGGSQWSKMCLELEARYSWGRTANRLAWGTLSAKERAELLPEPVIAELRETAAVLRRRIHDEFREQLSAQSQYE